MLKNVKINPITAVYVSAIPDIKKQMLHIEMSTNPYSKRNSFFFIKGYISDQTTGYFNVETNGFAVSHARAISTRRETMVNFTTFTPGSHPPRPAPCFS